jgi:DNA-directed DNA polymerase III PolC
MSYVPLHLHSAASPQWGVRPVAELCSAARVLGFETLALTDRNGLYAVPDFLAAARRCGLRPIIGAEALHGGQRAVLLARDAEGYANLCRLLSELHCRSDFDLAAALAHYRRGLTILTDQAELLAPLRRRGREHLYVELSPGYQLHRALALARELGLPPVATTRALLLAPDDFELHRVLRAIALNTKLSRLTDADTARDTDLLLAPEKLAEFFPHCPQALENSRKIAQECRSDWDFSATIFPAFRGLSQEAAYAQLEERARRGAKWRYGAIDGQVEERLQKELAIIGAKGFADYFLVVEEIARQSPRTCGRGSAAASLVAYCLGITHVDPLKHNLFFERFLHAGRSDPPDIDIDFPWDERDAVLDFAFSRYGAQRAAMVANQIGFKGRSALREVAKVYGLPDGEIKLLTERISGYWKAEQTAGAVTGHPLFAGEKFGADWQEILRIACRLGPQLRHLALHCGGLVIVPDEIRRYVPVEVSAKGLPVIQWEKDQAEAAGLVKIDILGNRSLAVIRDALAAVARHTGTVIDYASWRPLDDARTRALLTAGASMGCFYIESPATRQLLRRMWLNNPRGAACDLFEHLVMASSIIRPAANRFILEFVARMHGVPWRHLHPLLADVLEESYGIAVYQEQITQIAMALAGFSAHEGDQLRKIVCKKHKVQTLADYREKFLAGARDRGVPQAVTAAIWEQILSFAGYSFCKPHSASYALVSCKAAFLKANHPAEFMAAVISNQGGFYTPFAYLSEARRLGLKVLPPDINASEQHYRGEGKEIRIGLMQIHGLTAGGSRALLAERERGGPYRDFGDFLRRVPIDAEDVRRLVKAGGFDDLEGKERRPRLLWELLARGAVEPAGAPSLFDQPPVLPEPPGYDGRTVLNQELETLGMLVSCHPLDLHRRAIARIKPLPAWELGAWEGRYVTMIGWWVTGKPVQDKDGRPMEFVTFEDTTGLFDATFFPQAYARFCRKLTRLRPYLLKGKVEEAFGVATLTVEWVGYLDEA